MSRTVQLTRTYFEGNDLISQTENVVCETILADDFPVGAGQSNIRTQSFDPALAFGFMIASDQDIEVIFDTSPTTVITVYANVPLIWSEKCGFANPITELFNQYVVENLNAEVAAAVRVRFFGDV